MDTKRVSIIVPVFNTEQYLDKCMKSLMEQTYSNIEIIIIDDGSTDRSSEICDKFQKLDNRVKVFHISKGGVSSARNYGLSKVTGNYIMFCDSDDTADRKWVETMVKEKESGPYSLVLCNCKNLLDPEAESNVYDEKKLLEVFMDQGIGTVWNKIFEADIIRDNIRFELGLSYGEDKIFVLDYLLAGKTVNFLCINKTLYFHNTRNKYSLSKKYDSSRKAFLELEEERLVSLSKKHKDISEDIMRYVSLKKSIFLIEKVSGIYANSPGIRKYSNLKRFVKSKEFLKSLDNRDIERKLTASYLKVLRTKNAGLIWLYLSMGVLKWRLDHLWHG